MFKVGDKVKVVKDTCSHEYSEGSILTLKEKDNICGPCWRVEEGLTFVRDADIVPISEKILITTDGTTTIARLYECGKVIKTAEAKCAPGDTCDFKVGADLAYGRLMGDEAAAAPKYKPGDKVKVIANTCHHYADIGELVTLKDQDDLDDGGWHYQEHCGYIRERDIEPYSPVQDKPRFKVGDKVKYVGDGCDECRGKIATLVRKQPYACWDVKGDGVEGGHTKWGECDIEPYAEPEPILLYCVKEFPDRLEKGKTYEIRDGHMRGYKGGIDGSSFVTSFAEYAKIYPNMAACLFPLVKRPAKVGEWVYVTDCDKTPGYSGGIKVGDISEVVILNSDYGVYIKTNEKTPYGMPKDGAVTLIVNDGGYLVLDGYKPEPTYYSGKVICVESEPSTFTVGKTYEYKNGLIMSNRSMDARSIFYKEPYNMGNPAVSKEDALTRVGAKFIEYKGEA